MVTYFVGPFTPAVNSVVVTNTDNNAQLIGGGTGFANPFTFTALNFGTASANRYILVAFGSQSGSATHPPPNNNSVTIGGIAATLVGYVTDGGSNFTTMFIAPVPTGTSGNVVCTNPDTYGGRIGIGVWALTGLQSATPVQVVTNFAAGPLDITLTTAVTGGLIGFSCLFVNVVPTWTWVGLSNAAGSGFNGGLGTTGFFQMSGASLIGTNPPSITVDTNLVGNRMGISASFH